MSLYRNLGPMAFYDETALFQIFQTQQGPYILQLKPQFHPQHQQRRADLKTELVNHINRYDPSIKIDLYEEKGKPLSVILNGCIPFCFNQIEVHQLCRVIQAVQKTMLGWQNGKVGQLHKNLFFVSKQKILFVSMPVLSDVPNTPVQQLIHFLESICGGKQSSHMILFKKLRSCKNLKSLFEEARYFANVANLNLSQSKMSLGKSRLTKSSLHSQSDKRIRRKYPLFKKASLESGLFKESAKANRSLQWRNSEMANHTQQILTDNYRGTSKAVHYNSDCGFYKGRQSSNRKHRSQRKHSANSIKEGFSSFSKPRKSNHKKLQFYNSTSLVASKVYNQSYPIKGNNRNPKRHSPSKCGQSSHESRKSVKKESNNGWVKDMVNKSLQKWKTVHNKPKVIQNTIKNSNEGKRKLKKTGCLPPQSSQLTEIMEQVMLTAQPAKQKVQIIERLQLKIEQNEQLKLDFGNKDQVQEIKLSVLEHLRLNKNNVVQQKVEQLNKKDLAGKKETQKVEKDKRVSRQMIGKISLKDASNSETAKNSPSYHKKDKSSSSTRRKPGHKKLGKRQQPQFKKQIREHIEQLDRVGETVVNASQHLAKYPSFFYQLPMFLLYRQYYAQRTKAAEQGLQDLQEDNRSIEKSLKGLLKVTIKKGKTMPNWKQAISPNLHLDFTQDFHKQFMVGILNEYVKTLYELTHCSQSVYIHLAEVIDAWLIIQGQPTTQQARKLSFSSESEAKKFVKEGIAKLNKKLNDL